MKKYFVTAFVICFAMVQSFSQFRYGVKAGLNLSNVKDIGTTDNQNRLGFYAGLISEIGISEKFIVRPELLYSAKGYTFSSTAFNGSGTVNFNYLSIPIMVGYRPMEKFAIVGGPELSFLTNAQSKFDGAKHDVSKNFRKFDVALDLGAHYEIKNGIGLDLRYSYGFEDIADVVRTDQAGNEIGKDQVGSHRVLQFGLFYYFPHK